MEDLADKNVALLARIPEQSYTTTIVRDGNLEGEKDGHSSHIDGQGGKDENFDPNREGPGPNQPKAIDRYCHQE
jgi:hypothetical protein